MWPWLFFFLPSLFPPQISLSLFLRAAVAPERQRRDARGASFSSFFVCFARKDVPPVCGHHLAQRRGLTLFLDFKGER